MQQKFVVGQWLTILVLTVALVVLYADNKRTRDCISGYMVADSNATKARSDVADAERQAFKKTLQAIVDPKGTPETRRLSIDSYLDLVVKDDQVRAANPVQQVPTKCD